MPYEFTAEDFTKFTEDVLKANGDQGTLTSLIIDMQGTITEAVAQSTQTGERISKLEEENERLRARNLELFYQVGKEQRQRAGLPASDIDKGTKDEPEQKSTKDYMIDYFSKLDGKE